MNEYFFLYFLAIVWLVFATVYDFKRKEIPNWLTFSLMIFALAYRFFYSVLHADILFFLYGLFGFGVFVVLGYALYYSRGFGGGDAKLLMALGAVMPFELLNDFVILPALFLLILICCGAVYTVLGSLYVVSRNKKGFNEAAKKEMKKYGIYYWISLAVVLIIITVIYFVSVDPLRSYAFFLVILPLIFFYARAVDSGCMILEVETKKLTEGDWLVEDVNLKGRKIKKTVDGLTKEDIIYLRKHMKKIKIRTGLPFAVVFLISFMVFVWASSVFSFSAFWPFSP